MAMSAYERGDKREYTRRSDHRPRTGVRAGPSPANSTSPPGWGPGNGSRTGSAARSRPQLVYSGMPRSRAAAVATAVQSAFPRARYASAASAAAGVAQGIFVDEQLRAIQDAVEQANEWLYGESQAPGVIRNPGLQYVDTIQGPEWMVGPGPLQNPSSKEFTWNGLPGLGVTYLSSGTNPNTYKSYGWGTSTVAATSVDPGKWLGTFAEPLTWRYKSAQRRYQRQIQRWYNPTGSKQDVWVATAAQYAPKVRPEPLPATRNQEAKQVVITNPRIRDEVMITVSPTFVSVTQPPPHKPPPRVKETKARAYAAVGGVAFWAFEMADDITDWVNIVIAANDAVPREVRRGSNAGKMAWLAANAETLITSTDWAEVAAAMVGWLIDEKIGAMMGRMQRGARVSFGQPIGIKFTPSTGVGGSSIGGSVADFIATFL